MTDAGREDPVIGQERRRLAGHELDTAYGLVAYGLVSLAFGIDFPSHADIAAFLISGALFGALHLEAWRFWAALILVPAAVIAQMSGSVAAFTWLTGAARHEDLGTLTGWFLFTFLTWGPLLTLGVAIEMAMAHGKWTRG